MQQSGGTVQLSCLCLSHAVDQEMQQMFAHHQPLLLRVSRLTGEAPELQGRLGTVERAWSRACAFLQQWDARLREILSNCQVRNCLKT